MKNNSLLCIVPGCSMLLVLGIPQILIILWTVTQRTPDKCTFPPFLYNIVVLYLPNKLIDNVTSLCIVSSKET